MFLKPCSTIDADWDPSPDPTLKIDFLEYSRQPVRMSEGTAITVNITVSMRMRKNPKLEQF